MKITTELCERIFTKFYADDEIRQMAFSVIELIDDSKEDLSKEIIDSVDSYFEWEKDKWEIVKKYSFDSNSPLRFDDAVQHFIDDLVEVI